MENTITRANPSTENTKGAKNVYLLLLGNGSAEKFIGVHAVPGRLPQLLRFPGESAPAFCSRALHHATGSGAMWARLMYACDNDPPRR